MLNRIIGIFVVLAVGVLVYPFIFNPYDHFSGQTAVIKAPPFPSIQTQNDTIKALSQRNKLELPAKIKTSKLVNAKGKDKKNSPTPLKNVAWVIQVGPPQNKVKAFSLVNQLRAKGYNAFVHQINAAFGEDVQVYIGPEIKKDSAALLARKLTKETKLSGVVKTYKLLSA